MVNNATNLITEFVFMIALAFIVAALNKVSRTLEHGNPLQNVILLVRAKVIEMMDTVAELKSPDTPSVWTPDEAARVKRTVLFFVKKSLRDFRHLNVPDDVLGTLIDSQVEEVKASGIRGNVPSTKLDSPNESTSGRSVPVSDQQ